MKVRASTNERSEGAAKKHGGEPRDDGTFSEIGGAIRKDKKGVRRVGDGARQMHYYTPKLKSGRRSKRSAKATPSGARSCKKSPHHPTTTRHASREPPVGESGEHLRT